MPNTEKAEGPRSFARFIEALGEGDVHSELSEELFELGRQLLAQSRARNASIKGTLTLKLKFVASAKGVVDIEHAIETKVPRPKSAGSTMWLTKAGNLSPENTRQQTLPGIREVAALPEGVHISIDNPAVKEV